MRVGLLGVCETSPPPELTPLKSETLQLRYLAPDPGIYPLLWGRPGGRGSESRIVSFIHQRLTTYTYPPTGIWALDPVDGTKGFLRGGQYAVALGLIVDGKVVVGAMACPNLPVDPAHPDGPKGILVSAERGQGATAKPLDPRSTTPAWPIKMNAISSPAEASFCESVEAGHSAHGAQANIAKKLGIVKPSVRMDSQAKYLSIARGDGDVYLRLPVSASYEEKIWVSL